MMKGQCKGRKSETKIIIRGGDGGLVRKGGSEARMHEGKRE